MLSLLAGEASGRPTELEQDPVDADGVALAGQAASTGRLPFYQQRCTPVDALPVGSDDPRHDVVAGPSASLRETVAGDASDHSAGSTPERRRSSPSRRAPSWTSCGCLACLPRRCTWSTKQRRPVFGRCRSARRRRPCARNTDFPNVPPTVGTVEPRKNFLVRLLEAFAQAALTGRLCRCRW